MSASAKEKVDAAQAETAATVTSATGVASSATNGTARQRVTFSDQPDDIAPPPPSTAAAPADGAAAAPEPYVPIKRAPPKLTLTLGQVMLILGAGCLSSTSALLFWLKPGPWALAQWGIMGLGAGLAASYVYYKNKRAKAEINQLVGCCAPPCCHGALLLLCPACLLPMNLLPARMPWSC